VSTPEDAAPVTTWGPAGLHDLVDLARAALPGEPLTPDDLESLCFGPTLHGATTVLATADGHAAAVVSLGSEARAHLQLLVVHPSRRRRGLARRLVHEAERWAATRGATQLVVGAGAPVYLFTGVDSTWTEALCCFEALGYRREAVELDLVCPTRPSTRTPVPEGVVLERVGDDARAAALAAWSERLWPQWSAELERAAAAGTAVVAREGADGPILGAAAHSVGRLGVIGPVAVDPARHGGGVGAALVAAVLADLSAAGLDRAEIAWVSTVRFYVRACGARVGRTSVVLVRDLADLAVAVASQP
jgi:GNAT superfamily N-acetyltransferase